MQHLKELYSHSLNELNSSNQLHFSAHSHHLWPDSTLKATKQYWLDSSKLLDKKWDYIFSEVYPQAQKNISKLLNVSRYEDVFFASNTHDILIKIFSALGLGKKKLKVLSTNGEFHSFSRQAKSWIKEGFIEVDFIEINTDYSHENQILNHLQDKQYDIVFISHVFFQTGIILNNLNAIHENLNQAHLIIDGYHSLGAIEIDLSFLENASNIFYLGGGYKYLQAGEGACFCLAPYKHNLKPHITGWFAEFGELQNKKHESDISYSKGGMAFGGATFDPTGLYRLNASFKSIFNKYTQKEIREYIQELKQYFLDNFVNSEHLLSNCRLVENDISKTGSFISLIHPQASELSQKLLDHGVYTDARDCYLRFGFGLYQDKNDIEKLFKNTLCAHKPL